MRLNSKKTLIFLNVVSGMRPALKKYQNEKERNSFLSIYKDINTRSQEIDRIIQSAHFSSLELKQINKEVNRWPWKKIRLIFFLGILSALVASYVYFLSLPRVYKISKETKIFKDSTLKIDTLLPFDFSDNSGAFIKSNDSKNTVLESNFTKWLFNNAEKYYIDTNCFIQNKQDFDLYQKTFLSFQGTTEYDDLKCNDKKAIVFLLQSLPPDYKFQFHPTSFTCIKNFVVIRNSNKTVLLVNVGNKKDSKFNEGYSISYNNVTNPIFIKSLFKNNIYGDSFPSFVWFKIDSTSSGDVNVSLINDSSEIVASNKIDSNLMYDEYKTQKLKLTLSCP